MSRNFSSFSQKLLRTQDRDDMNIRKAAAADVPAAAAIYERIHDMEEQGKAVIGGIRGVYPTEETAGKMLRDLFVMEDGGRIVASAVINQAQVPCYAEARWSVRAPADEVMVLHTLTVDPACGGKGYGRAFVAFYEEYARRHGCLHLRMDTNERNARAREMYRSLGYREADIVDCTFNGIPGVRLVCLEKELSTITEAASAAS